MHAPQTSCLHTGIRYWGPPLGGGGGGDRGRHPILRCAASSPPGCAHPTTPPPPPPPPDQTCPAPSPPCGHTPGSPTLPHRTPSAPPLPPALPPAQPPASLAIPLPHCTPASPSPSSWSRPCSGVPRPAPTARLLLLGKTLRWACNAPHRTPPLPGVEEEEGTPGSSSSGELVPALRSPGACLLLLGRRGLAPYGSAREEHGRVQSEPEKRNPTMMIRSPQLPSNLLGRHCLNGRSTERGERDWRRTDPLGLGTLPSGFTHPFPLGDRPDPRLHPCPGPPQFPKTVLPLQPLQDRPFLSPTWIEVLSSVHHVRTVLPKTAETQDLYLSPHLFGDRVPLLHTPSSGPVAQHRGTFPAWALSSGPSAPSCPNPNFVPSRPVGDPIRRHVGMEED